MEMDELANCLVLEKEDVDPKLYYKKFTQKNDRYKIE